MKRNMKQLAQAVVRDMAMCRVHTILAEAEGAGAMIAVMVRPDGLHGAPGIPTAVTKSVSAIGPSSARSARLRRAAGRRILPRPAGPAARRSATIALRARGDMLDDVMRLACQTIVPIRDPKARAERSHMLDDVMRLTIRLKDGSRGLDVLCKVHAILAEAEDTGAVLSAL